MPVALEDWDDSLLNEHLLNKYLPHGVPPLSSSPRTVAQIGSQPGLSSGIVALIVLMSLFLAAMVAGVLTLLVSRHR